MWLLKLFILALVFASWIYWLIAWRAVVWFFRTRFPTPQNFHPSISILRPVKGADAHAYDNFASLYHQDYQGEIEILFGVADEKDQALPIIRKLQHDFPSHRIRLIVAPSDFINPKVGNLHHLASAATGELLVLSDADIRVGPDYLTRVTAPLSEPTIGVVTCPYHGLLPESFAAHLEAQDIEAQFFPALIIASRLLHVRMGLGATIAIRRTDLDRIGGFASISDYLADDFQLADRIANLGLKIHLSDYVVSSALGKVRFIDHWNRQVRWMRCVRVSAPGRYPGVVITFSTPLAALLLLFPHFLAPALCALGVSILIRYFIAWRVRRFLHLSPRDLYYLPLRDFLTAIVFLVAAFGNRVRWRGHRFKVLRDGRLVRLAEKKAPAQRFIFFIDRLLRRQQGIYEFTNDPACLFRLGLSHCQQDLALPGGLSIKTNDPILELHFWSDHFPLIPQTGPDLEWGKRITRQYARTLQLLADHIDSNTEYRNIKAVHGVVNSISVEGLNHLEHIGRRSGFDFLPAPEPRTFLSRLHQRGEDLLIWLLHWSFTPTSHRGRFGQKRFRCDCWISTQSLLARHRPKPEPQAQATSEPIAPKDKQPQCSP